MEKGILKPPRECPYCHEEIFLILPLVPGWGYCENCLREVEIGDD